ncbi:hypothetical protein HHK36_010653 [Tetracentron sinense]|uniref:Protein DETOXIFICATION n=1 Tax=Tetracentron sinense TaxID=13715 RepID=A0A834Z9Z1_TETSI|nr:hypothetical protein HHK36_010653 [Tetracentron sinense]
MAISLSYPILYIYSEHRDCCCFCYSKSSTSKSAALRRNPNSRVRLRAIPRSSPRKNRNTPLESSSEESKPPISLESIKNPNPPAGSWFTDSVSRPLHRLRNELKFDELGMEILSIALPAALALAADPIASLVDTAFIGHLGSVELAAVGVSISVFNLVSKLFNVPLLNITTSFVAEEQALKYIFFLSDGSLDYVSVLQDPLGDEQRKKFLPSVSTSLALAAGIGIAEAVALSIGSGFLMNLLGIPVDSPIRIPAEHFLTLRAFGAPPIVIALAAQGTFRGFMDTKTPLYAVGKHSNLSYLFSLGPGISEQCLVVEPSRVILSGWDCVKAWDAICAGNLLNAILDPILIFLFGLGIGGAAISTVISEYLITFILLWELNAKVSLIPPNIGGMGVGRYLKSGMSLAN